MKSVVIVGGGVVGLCSALALALARAGHGVTVLEPAPAREASSWNNAGHIAVEQLAPLASLASLRSAWRRRFGAGGALALPAAEWRSWLPFGVRLAAAARPARFRAGRAALAMLLGEAMPAWERVTADIGRSDLLRADGHLVAWESTASAAAGLRAWQQEETGTATIAPADPADRDRVAALAHGIAGVARFAGSGQVDDLGALADALEAALIAAGGRIVRTTATLSVVDGVARIAGYDADLVLVAAGVGSGALLRAAGHRVPIVAERGYHIRADARDWPVDLPPVVFEDRSVIVTRYAGTVQASGYVEVAAPDAPPDPRKWERLEAHVAALGLPMRPPFARWMGARPTLPDYLPAIGRSRRAGNLLYAFGHQHLGLTLAPITAELIAAMVADRPPAIDLSPFDLTRFGARA